MADVEPGAGAGAVVGAALKRLGNDMVHSGPLCRNVLRDLFPDNARAVSVLTAAVETGAATRLLQLRTAIDPQLLMPQLVNTLVLDRGIDERWARWAILTWAEALGYAVDAASLPTWTASNPILIDESPDDGPPASDPPDHPERPQTPDNPPPGGQGPVDDYAPIPSKPSGGGLKTVLVEPHQTDGGTGPDEIRVARRPGRRVVILSALLLVIVIAAVVTIVSVATAGAHGDLRARALSGADATLSRDGDASPLKGDEVDLQLADVVSVKRGIVEVTTPTGVVRLNAGARASIVPITAKSKTGIVSLANGRMFANASSKKSLALRAADGSATVAKGRLAVSCTAGACVYQALDEPQRVVTSLGTVTLTAHQSVPGSSVTPTFTAPDAIREDPWIAKNLTLDGSERRTSRAVTGDSIIGDWTFTYTSEFVSVPVAHQVKIATSCSTNGGCSLKATTVYDTCPTALSCDLTGPVRVDSKDGTNVVIDYPSVEAACDNDSKAGDGTGTYVDTVDLSTGKGSRSAKYVAAKGSLCAKDTFADLRTQTLPIVAAAGAGDGSFPSTAAERYIMERMIGNSTKDCSTASGRPSFAGDVTCNFGAASDGHARPKQVEIAASSLSDVKSLYDQVVADGAKPYGSCGTTCTVYGGAGKARLAKYAQHPVTTTILLVENGSSVKALDTWLDDYKDVFISGFLSFGL